MSDFHFIYRGKRIAPKKHRASRSYHNIEGPKYNTKTESNQMLENNPELVEELREAQNELITNERERDRIIKKREKLVRKMVEIGVKPAVIALLVPNFKHKAIQALIHKIRSKDKNET